MSFPIEYRRNLPHIIPPGGTFFLTFRLKGSIPNRVILNLKESYELELSKLEKRESYRTNFKYIKEVQQAFFTGIDNKLDFLTSGPHWLSNPKIANIVQEAIHYRDNKDYELISYCIMSNHVHLICTMTQDDIPLFKVIGSLKRHTARQANKILKRTGAFWLDESYDHLVRSRNELGRIINYTLNNPVKAGLVDDWKLWEYSYVNEDYLEEGLMS